MTLTKRRNTCCREVFDFANSFDKMKMISSALSAFPRNSAFLATGEPRSGDSWEPWELDWEKQRPGNRNGLWTISKPRCMTLHKIECAGFSDYRTFSQIRIHPQANVIQLMAIDRRTNMSHHTLRIELFKLFTIFDPLSVHALISIHPIFFNQRSLILTIGYCNFLLTNSKAQ